MKFYSGLSENAYLQSLDLCFVFGLIAFESVSQILYSFGITILGLVHPVLQFHDRREVVVTFLVNEQRNNNDTNNSSSPIIFIKI